MCSISFWTSSLKAVYIQNLVKRFDGRFQTNLVHTRVVDNPQYVAVSFADCKNMNQFCLMQRITDMRFF